MVSPSLDNNNCSVIDAGIQLTVLSRSISHVGFDTEEFWVQLCAGLEEAFYIVLAFLEV